MTSVFQALLGLILFPAAILAISKNVRSISWRRVSACFGLTFVAGLMALKIPWVVTGLTALNHLVGALERATTTSTSFLFGYLGGAGAPFEVKDENKLFIVAFRVLPLILVISALSAVLVRIRVIPFLVNLFGKLLRRTLNLSPPLSFGSAASLYFGTIETPLLIRSYLSSMTEPQLLALLTCTMATVSGSVMVLYSTVLSGVVPEPLTHMVVASLLSIPSALLLSELWMPMGDLQSSDRSLPDWVAPDTAPSGIIEALLSGIKEGLEVVLNVMSVILVTFALLELLNAATGSLTTFFAATPITLETLAGQLLRPLMWLTGISWEQTEVSGKLMGTKILANEFVAFLQIKADSSPISPETRLPLLYALCGFANLGSLGIVVGGLRPLLPGREAELVRCGLRSLVTGNLATLMTGAWITILNFF